MSTALAPCRKCGGERRSRPYLGAVCLRCQSRAVRKWKSRNPHKVLAQRALQRAVRRGRIERQPCQRCGIEPAEGHHPDYRDPLRVEWLCRRHHAAVHRRRR